MLQHRIAKLSNAHVQLKILDVFDENDDLKQTIGLNNEDGDAGYQHINSCSHSPFRAVITDSNINTEEQPATMKEANTNEKREQRNSSEGIIRFVTCFDGQVSDDDEHCNESRADKGALADSHRQDDDQDCIFLCEIRTDRKGAPPTTSKTSTIKKLLVRKCDDNKTKTVMIDAKYAPSEGIDVRNTSQAPSDSASVTVLNDAESRTAACSHADSRAVEVDHSANITHLTNASVSREHIVPKGLITSENSFLACKTREQLAMILCEKLGVTHHPLSVDVMKRIKARRSEFPMGFKEFDEHIWKHYQINAQNDLTFSWKMEVRDRLLALVRTVYPEATLFAVGSTVNGCGAYNSDMDLCLCVSHPDRGYSTGREYSVDVLTNLLEVFISRSDEFVKQCCFVPAKVPILRLEMGMQYSDLEVDINCNNIAGIYNSHLLHYYSRIDERFPALCLVVKHWAIVTKINDAMSGTFNSYSLILMVLHFLQCATMPPVLPNLQVLHPNFFSVKCDINQLKLFHESLPLPPRPLNDDSVGELLIAFFDYYAKFNFKKKAISVSRGCIFDRSLLQEMTRRHKVFIEEPFDHQNTARCVNELEKFNYIKRAFLNARNALLSRVPTLQHIGVH